MTVLGHLKNILCNKKSICVYVLVFFIVLFSMIGACLFNVNHDEYGIVYNSLTKQVEDEVRTEGRHLLPAFSELIKFQRTYITIELLAEEGDAVKCLTSNGLTMTLDMTVQYQWLEAELLQLFRQFGTSTNAHKFLLLITTETFREVCALYNAQDYYFKRFDIEQNMKTALQKAFQEGGAHARINLVQLLNIDLPRRFESAIVAGQLAAQDITKAKNERAQVEIKAETRVAEANQQEKILVFNAEASADAIVFGAVMESTALKVRYESLSGAFEYVMNRTELPANKFVGSYLQAKLLRESTGDISPVVTFQY